MTGVTSTGTKKDSRINNKDNDWKIIHLNISNTFEKTRIHTVYLLEIWSKHNFDYIPQQGPKTNLLPNEMISRPKHHGFVIMMLSKHIQFCFMKSCWVVFNKMIITVKHTNVQQNDQTANNHVYARVNGHQKYKINNYLNNFQNNKK